MIQLNDRTRAVLFIGGGVLCFALVWGLVRGFSGSWPWGTPTGVAGPSLSIRQAMQSSPEVSFDNDQKNFSPDGKKDSPQRWIIYLTGEVSRPGIIEISPDSRLYEAVDAAGGLTSRADKEGINLAEKLSDGVHVHIPGAGEAKANVKSQVTGGLEEETKNGLNATGQNKLVDINHATPDELESLPGIGPKLAQEIIQDRTSKGPFQSQEDLLRVKGIGPSKLEKIKGLIIPRP